MDQDTVFIHSYFYGRESFLHQLTASALAKESPKQKRKNMGDITNLVMAGARFGASEREVCTIVNAVREDDGVDLKENPHLVMIKCTQQRKRF